MKTLWIAILWFFFSLCVGSIWAGVKEPGKSVSEVEQVPFIHLARINDPVGTEGFDLSCKAQKEDEPLCVVSVVGYRKKIQDITIPFERAHEMAKIFLDRMPRSLVQRSSIDTKLNPPIHDVLLLWKVKLGDRQSSGFVKRSGQELGVDPTTLHAVLALESQLWQEK